MRSSTAAPLRSRANATAPTAAQTLARTTSAPAPNAGVCPSRTLTRQFLASQRQFLCQIPSLNDFQCAPGVCGDAFTRAFYPTSAGYSQIVYAREWRLVWLLQEGG